MDSVPPLVSIIVINYNYAHFLHRSIGSALSQTHPAVEVVVVDDASTDGSAEVIRGYGTAVTPVLRPVNRGHGAGFNAGFAVCRGDIVIFLDADDYLDADAAAAVAAAWAPDIAKVQYRLHLVDAGGSVVDVYPPREIAFDSGDVVPLLLRSGRYQTTVTSGNAFARRALAAVMPMPEDDFRQGADGYLVTLAPLFGRVVSLDTPLGAYCQHGGNHAAGVGDGLAARSRWRLQHDRHRYAALARAAAALGLTPRPDPGLSDSVHLEERLASLRLAPDRHPYPDDSRFALACHGLRASAHARLSWRRRIILGGFFLCAGLLPDRFARLTLSWKLVRHSRPRTIDRLIHHLRRAAG
jgi:hypothetical protein